MLIEMCWWIHEKDVFSSRWARRLGRINPIVYSRKFFPNSARSHWFLRGHMTSNNETVSHQKISERTTLQNLWRQRVTLHCYPRMLTDDRRYSKVKWISSVRISSHITNHLMTVPSGNDWSLGKQLILFPSGPVINCLVRQQESNLWPSGPSCSKRW